jgi:uncharacterized membrane protein
MNKIFNTETGRAQNIFRILLGAGLLYAGISHLAWNKIAFLAQVPKWVPLNAELVVFLSGIVEISLGSALLFLPGKSVMTGWVVAAFFVAIFPGNISQYVNGIDSFGLNSDQSRMIRLFFQPLLVFWALKSTGAWNALRNKSSKEVELQNKI